MVQHYEVDLFAVLHLRFKNTSSQPCPAFAPVRLPRTPTGMQKPFKMHLPHRLHRTRIHHYGTLATKSTGLQTSLHRDTATYLTAHRDATFMGDVNMPHGQALSLHVTMWYPRVQNQLFLAGPLQRTHVPSATDHHGPFKRQIPRWSRSALLLKTLDHRQQERIAAHAGPITRGAAGSRRETGARTGGKRLPARPCLRF